MVKTSNECLQMKMFCGSFMVLSVEQPQGALVGAFSVPVGGDLVFYVCKTIFELSSECVKFSDRFQLLAFDG